MFDAAADFFEEEVNLLPSLHSPPLYKKKQQQRRQLLNKIKTMLLLSLRIQIQLAILALARVFPSKEYSY